MKNYAHQKSGLPGRAAANTPKRISPANSSWGDNRPAAIAQRRLIAAAAAPAPEIKQLAVPDQPVIQRGRDKGNNRKGGNGRNDKRPKVIKNRKYQLGAAPQEIIVRGRALRSTPGRQEQFVKGSMRASGRVTSTRAYKGAQQDKAEAERQLGSGPVHISSGPPVLVDGRRVWSGDRSGLTFTQATETHVYDQYVTRVHNGRTEYQVGRQWLPRLRDATVEEAHSGQYTSIDHRRDFADTSRALDRHTVVHEGFEWEVTYFDEAKDLYNDTDNLVLKSQSDNSSKSGKKGMDHMGPRRGKRVKEDIEMDDESNTEAPDEPWDKDRDSGGPPPPAGGAAGALRMGIPLFGY